MILIKCKKKNSYENSIETNGKYVNIWNKIKILK